MKQLYLKFNHVTYICTALKHGLFLQTTRANCTISIWDVSNSRTVTQSKLVRSSKEYRRRNHNWSSKHWYKKSELMIMRRARAENSSCSLV